jgi:hypothetical protein
MPKGHIRPAENGNGVFVELLKEYGFHSIQSVNPPCGRWGPFCNHIK